MDQTILMCGCLQSVTSEKFPTQKQKRKYERSAHSRERSAHRAESTKSTTQQEKERNKAFDLLDGLSRSGALRIDAASFHVVVAATHCFDKTLINTVVQDNINPIDKVERSALIVGATIHEQSPEEMIKQEHIDRIKNGCSSHLF